MLPLCALLASSGTGTAVESTPSPFLPPVAEGDMQLSLLPSSLPAAKGGRCLDSSMAGYYFRQGSADTFVIYLKGGGACYDKISCLERAKTDLGSSKGWAERMKGTGLQSASCSENPAFCNATAVYLPYCTGDTHFGNNTVATDTTWNLIFDGHANFASIIDELEAKHGLRNAKNVLLAGGSAGGIGTFVNADYLAGRLPHATVKGAPNAGWFFPAALPSDLPHIYAPSDWAHFKEGTHGNMNYDNKSVPAFISGELWDSRGLMPAACIADQKPDEWWACGSLHTLYKYIKTPLFVLENQYDTNQIFAQEQAPQQASDAHEYATLVSYIVMYGEAMRNSTAQVLQDAPLSKAPGTDGIFHPSCLQHGVGVTLQGQSWQPIVSDWFWGTGQLKQYYRMVEAPSAAGEPSNPAKQCALPAGPGPSKPTPAPAPGGGCAAQLKKDGCLQAGTDGLNPCEQCAEAHFADLEAAGCTSQKEVKDLCEGSN